MRWENVSALKLDFWEGPRVSSFQMTCAQNRANLLKGEKIKQKIEKFETPSLNLHVKEWISRKKNHPVKHVIFLQSLNLIEC